MAKCTKSNQPTEVFLGVSNEIFPDQNWTTRRYFDREFNEIYFKNGMLLCHHSYQFLFISNFLHRQGHNKESMNEWDIAADCDRGKACYWAGVHRHAMTSFDYNSVKYRPDIRESLSPD